MGFDNVGLYRWSYDWNVCGDMSQLKWLMLVKDKLS